MLSRTCELRCTLALVGVVFLQLLACGGAQKTNHYERAMSKQDRCCQALEGEARAQCTEAIVRVSDESTEDSRVNDATFRCVEVNFVCDAATGRATQEASQAALDCITDLDS